MELSRPGANLWPSHREARVKTSLAKELTRGQSDIPVNRKHLYDICTMLDQRRRRWVDVVQMLYKCFLFTGISLCLYTSRSSDVLLMFM